MLLLTIMSVRVKVRKNRYIIFESEDDCNFVKSLEKGLSDFIVENLHKEDMNIMKKRKAFLLVFCG